jgi:modulator of FtsH protease
MRKETFQRKVLPMFFLSLIVASIGVFAGLFVPPVLYLPIAIAEFIILIAAFFLRRRGNIHMGLVFLFVFLTGITTTPIIVWADFQGGSVVILEALGITTVVFGGLSAYVYFTNKDFRSWGTFLGFSLIGLILASLVNFFLGNAFFGIIIDVAVLLIFLGFVMYDMSKILRDYGEDDVSLAVLSLYLDFLNIFIRILQLLVLSKRRD